MYIMCIGVKGSTVILYFLFSDDSKTGDLSIINEAFY